MGAFPRKSSPGKGGPGLGPEKGAASSAPDGEVKRTVVTGTPSMTAHPS